MRPLGTTYLELCERRASTRFPSFGFARNGPPTAAERALPSPCRTTIVDEGGFGHPRTSMRGMSTPATPPSMRFWGDGPSLGQARGAPPYWDF